MRKNQTKCSKYLYVRQLSKETQEEILYQISLFLYQVEGIARQDQEEHLEKAKSSRLVDLEEVIDIEDYSN